MTIDPRITAHMARADIEAARLGEQIRSLCIQQGKWRDLSRACVAMYDLDAGHEFFDHAPEELAEALEALGLPALTDLELAA
jgi:hypothetical protein